MIRRRFERDALRRLTLEANGISPAWRQRSVRKCLLGVTIGEGTICAIYIFLGARALAWLR
jgi:hypothetical protein